MTIALEPPAATHNTGVAWFGGVRPETRILVFAGLLAVLGGLLMAATPGAFTVPERQWHLPFPLLAGAFAVAEASALHVELRKGSHSLSLSAIPLLFGAIYTSPGLLAAAYVTAAAPTLLWIRRSEPIKVLWNCSLFFAEAALVGFIVRSSIGSDLPNTAIDWIAPFGAALAAELLSLVAVPLVIMVFDATFRPELFRDVGRSQLVATLTAGVTVSIAASSAVDPYLTLYAVLPMFGLGALLRSTGRLAQRYRDLAQLHGFHRVLAGSRREPMVDSGLLHLAHIMRCQSAYLLIAARDDARGTARGLVGDEYVDLAYHHSISRFVELVELDGVAQFDAADPRHEVREMLRWLGASRIVAARVLAQVGRDAVLVLGDRLGMRDDFTADETRVFGSMADTMGARLANDHLVERLEVQAQQDALTKLPNRFSFEAALAEVLTAPGRTGAVVMVDLDRFKEINDLLGHDTGDRLLIEVARRLQSSVRGTEFVARFGGDEFAMLLDVSGSGSIDTLGRRIQDIRDGLTHRVEIDGIELDIGASLGVARWPLDGTTGEDLLRRADAAMYQAKRNQIGVAFYWPELDADAPRRIELSMSCRAALERDEFTIHLQPKVDAQDGRIVGAEALVRWTHPRYGAIPPTEFIPLLTQAGLNGKLTRTVAARAAQAARELRDAGLEIPVAINLTPRDLLDGTLPDSLVGILAAAGLPPTAFEIEVTEDAMIVDFDASVSMLDRLRSAGMCVSIDDFGTGYSSLQRLHRLPIDQLKIDRSFVGRLAYDSGALSIVRAAIRLARDFGLTTVVEGVENRETLELVRQLGCDQVQGYLIGRPVPLGDFLRWAREWRDGQSELVACGAVST